MSVLTFAVRFCHTAGLDRPGRLGQEPGKFLGSCTLAFFFFFALVLPRLLAPSRLLPVLLFLLPTLLLLLPFVRCRSHSHSPSPCPS